MFKLFHSSNESLATSSNSSDTIAGVTAKSPSPTNSISRSWIAGSARHTVSLRASNQHAGSENDSIPDQLKDSGRSTIDPVSNSKALSEGSSELDESLHKTAEESNFRFTDGAVLFGKFKVIRHLSRPEPGTIKNGSVLLCSVLENSLLGDSKRLVALKVADQSGPFSELSGLTLEREYRAARALLHPNILHADEFYSGDNLFGYSMEYLSGGSVRDQINANQLAVSDILSVLSQIARGLAAIHQAGIIHRDLKPENILICGNGRAKITDFGIALVPGVPNYVCEQRIVGTVDYLAPEYVQSGQCSELSDIFAFGVLAYELLTGRVPFAGESLVDRLMARVTETPELPHIIRKECPVELGLIILKALKAEPTQRYQSGVELCAALDAIVDKQSFTLVKQNLISTPSHQFGASSALVGRSNVSMEANQKANVKGEKFYQPLAHGRRPTSLNLGALREAKPLDRSSWEPVRSMTFAASLQANVEAQKRKNTTSLIERTKGYKRSVLIDRSALKDRMPINDAGGSTFDPGAVRNSKSPKTGTRF